MCVCVPAHLPPQWICLGRQKQVLVRHLNTARHSGLSERLLRSSLLSSSSPKRDTEKRKREGGRKGWRVNEQLSPAEIYVFWHKGFFFSAKTSLFPRCPLQLMFEVLKRGGKRIGSEADWICLLTSCCGFRGLVGKRAIFTLMLNQLNCPAYITQWGLLNEIKFLHISLSCPVQPLCPVFKRYQNLKRCILV